MADLGRRVLIAVDHVVVADRAGRPRKGIVHADELGSPCIIGFITTAYRQSSPAAIGIADDPAQRLCQLFS